MDPVRALVDSDNRVYGFRVRCSACDGRTVLSPSKNGAVKLFMRGRFVADGWKAGRK